MKDAQNPQTFPQWYIGKNDSWTGPFPEPKILQMINQGAASWVDFVWNEQSGFLWRRLCDLPQLKAKMPPPPPKSLIDQIKQSHQNFSESPSAVPQPARRTLWFLQIQGSQFGPVTTQEAQSIILSGKINGAIFAKQKGENRWQAINMIPELSPQNEKNRRNQSRVPLLASVKFTSHDRTLRNPRMGFCRDISLTGMLVHCDQLSELEGEELKMEVNPVTAHTLATFTTSAQIVRINSKDHTFSVKFKSISAPQLQNLKKYLEES